MRSRARLWRMVARFIVKAGGAMLRALAPRHHPDETPNPAWIERWRAAYGGQERAEQTPLLQIAARRIEPRSV